MGFLFFMDSFIFLLLNFIFLINERGFLGKFNLVCIVKDELFWLSVNCNMLFLSIRLLFRI